MAYVEKVSKYLNEENKYIKVLTVIGIIAVSTISIIQAIQFIQSNFWKPTITVKNVDFEKAIAQLTVNGNDQTLYGNTIMNASGDWGVQFGTTGAEDQTYSTLELIKNGMVYKILQTKQVA